MRRSTLTTFGLGTGVESAVGSTGCVASRHWNDPTSSSGSFGPATDLQFHKAYSAIKRRSRCMTSPTSIRLEFT
jgi:hypothetical protein